MQENTIGDILRKLLFHKKMKVIDLARAANIPQPTVQRIVAGDCSRPHLSSLKPIADFFAISIEQLKGEQAIDWLKDSAQYFEEIGMRCVPILDWLAIASWLENKHSINHQRQILTERPISPDGFALIIKDSAMEPLFTINTQIIFDPNKPYSDRSYVLAKLNQQPEPIFRQLVIDGNDLFIKPVSPDLEHFRIHHMSKNDTIIAVLIEAKHFYG